MYKLFIPFLLLSLFSFSCEKNGEQINSALNRSKGISDIVPLNKDFNIKIGKTVEIENENVTIYFESVPMDSRCPEGVLCFWSGEAQVILRIDKPGYPEVTDTLSLYEALVGTKRITSYQVYSIEFKALEPHPIFNIDLNPDEYAATLFVTKKVTKIMSQANYNY